MYTADYASLQAIADGRGIDLSRVPRKSQTAIFAGTLLSIWGHFITDCMRLLWFLRSQEYAGNFSGLPVIYITDSTYQMDGNHKRLLEIMGIDTSGMIPVTELTFFDKIILPDECFFAWNGRRYFTREYVAMFNAVRDFAAANAKPTKSDKVYFSYSRYKNGKVFGEDKLEKYFASKGYEIVYPETLTLDEQLRILAGTKSFASTVGSCSHNVLFLKDGTEVILIPRNCYMNGYQLALNHVHSLNVSYVDSSFSIFMSRTGYEGPFLYYISSNLRRYFHDEDTRCIVSASYFMRYSRSPAKADNPNAYRYYSAVAAEYFGKLFDQSWRGKLRRMKEALKRIDALRNFVRKVRRMIRRK